ncbi:hypothetical protein SEA_MABODAMACA_49 [Microbacterium phage Mabodamaca]|uniref:Uncharacterized protein n=1 Tax=Microbacterium phage Mabodamaca TaxID=3078574 RepID=A0AA96NAT2_9CAUD|nr:hypothetical protein SEA_MABODAMACA_49 [Microbacterium phage Mabodamaca]
MTRRIEPQTMSEAAEVMHLALLRIFVVMFYLPIIRPLTRYLLRKMTP